MFPVPIRASCRRHESCRNIQARLPPSASGATGAILRSLHQSCWHCAITLRSASAHRLRKLRTSSHAPLREMTHSQFQSSCSASIASPFAPPLRQCHTTTPTPSGTCPSRQVGITNPHPSAPVVVTSLIVCYRSSGVLPALHNQNYVQGPDKSGQAEYSFT